MGKVILSGLAVAWIVVRLSDTGVARAQTLEQANAKMETTQHRLADQVTKTASTATTLAHELDQPEQVVRDLQGFVDATSRARQLAEELSRDIDVYDVARVKKLDAFDRELQAINDPLTHRQMERLRNRTAHDTGERVTLGRSSLSALQQVLAHGADVEHAARCVQLSQDLATHGEDLVAQVQRAKQEATNYARLTTTFLASLARQTQGTTE